MRTHPPPPIPYLSPEDNLKEEGGEGGEGREEEGEEKRQNEGGDKEGEEEGKEEGEEEGHAMCVYEQLKDS